MGPRILVTNTHSCIYYGLCIYYGYYEYYLWLSGSFSSQWVFKCVDYTRTVSITWKDLKNTAIFSFDHAGISSKETNLLQLIESSEYVLSKLLFFLFNSSVLFIQGLKCTSMRELLLSYSQLSIHCCYTSSFKLFCIQNETQNR